MGKVKYFITQVELIDSDSATHSYNSIQECVNDKYSSVSFSHLGNIIRGVKMNNDELTKTVKHKDGTYIVQFSKKNPQSTNKKNKNIKKEKKEIVRIKIGDNLQKDDNTRWIIEANQYKWQSRGEEIAIDIKFADDLFFAFSEHGKDLSQNEIRTQYDISARYWHSLKSALELYKSSDIVSPHSRSLLTVDEYNQLLDIKMKEYFVFKKRSIQDKFNKSHLKQLTKWRDKANENAFASETILSELSDWIDDKQYETIKIAINENCKKSKTVYAATSDWHLGSEITADYSTLKDYNSEILFKGIQSMCEDINSQNAEEVVLFFGGDIVHTFTGAFKPEMWKDLEKGLYGSAVIMRAIDLFEYMISNIANLKRIVAVGGNHDRMIDKFRGDTRNEIATLIFDILKRFYSDKIDVQYDQFVATYKTDKINFILTHGDSVAAKKDDGLVNDFGVSDRFNLILSGDWHTRLIPMDAWNRRHVKIPSLYTGDQYSAKLGFSAVAGYLLINEEFGLPQIMDRSIQI